MQALVWKKKKRRGRKKTSCAQVILSACRGSDLLVYFCTSVPLLTFWDRKQARHEHMFMWPLQFCLPFFFFPGEAWKIFWTLKFSVIVWCDRCENRSGWTWLMLSSQHCAMIETGITAVVKKEPVLTFDWCAMCACVFVCLSGPRHPFYGRTVSMWTCAFATILNILYAVKPSRR